ncbi:Na+/H+ antiporter subunit E [Streptomyces viridochromogenes]|uniref:Putative Cation antiporter n=1 Tax=Streptomyces viridochromogenes Tue57 TaxID=1160705 RepID=L8PJH2_STRVR|nr:Na+/H+ antiporter subunit E [Streptomyces viridochromogenes]ELS57671.1 putative Cation antiporter [Streptomyces viridochromogenes Tue57]
MPSFDSPERVRRGLRHLPMIAWLWILWILLWGSTGAVVLVGGLLVAVAVVLAFPLPAVLPGAAPRPLRTAGVLLHLLMDLVRSGTTVAWQVVRHGRRTSSAIIEVPLHVDSDLLITAVAELTTMTPGTLVAEIDRRRKRLYVHALPVRDRQDISRRRSGVQAVERRVARAAGHRDNAGTPGADPEPADHDARHIRRRKP